MIVMTDRDDDKTENMKNKTIEFKSKSGLMIRASIEIDIEHPYGGWYEAFDIATEGLGYYIEGVLEIDFLMRTLDGYDGTFELPQPIVDAVVEMGYESLL